MTRSRERSTVASFRRAVLAHYRAHGRHDLPWRHTIDPHRILVSEVMLQQTQVSRVSPKYREFLRIFPSVRTLAEASLSDVLRAWSGLGYNRRAKFLHDAAKEIVAKHRGKVPRSYEELVALPGIGDYTAKAVRVFAWNEPEHLIETNIRTTLIHHFFSSSRRPVSDHTLLALLSKVSRKGQSKEGKAGMREWYWALMDYGAHLKQSGVRVNARSVHYVKQSKFEGSLRQVRGAILKAVTDGKSIEDLKSPYIDRFDKALASLVRDGLVEK